MNLLCPHHFQWRITFAHTAHPVCTVPYVCPVQKTFSLIQWPWALAFVSTDTFLVYCIPISPITRLFCCDSLMLMLNGYVRYVDRKKSDIPKIMLLDDL